MIRFLLISFSVLIFANASFADCATNKDVLGATYRVTTTQNGKTHATQHVVLWRNGRQVAHEYIDTRVTEVWEDTRSGMLRLVRHFDIYRRGIEYQPNEINHGKGERDWGLKYQLISNELKDKMQLVKSKEKGCDNIETYQLIKGEMKVDLEWLPKQNLVKSYHARSANKEVKWQLKNTNLDAAKVKQIFATRSNYQTTDYTDIGDNESDPFLSKMINLGFVKHGAAGFYDADGHSMGAHRH